MMYVLFMLKETLEINMGRLLIYAMPSQYYERRTGAEGSVHAVRPYGVIESELSPSKPFCYKHAKEIITQVRRAQIVGVRTRAAESVVTRCQGPSSLVYEIHNRYLEIQ